MLVVADVCLGGGGGGGGGHVQWPAHFKVINGIGIIMIYIGRRSGGGDGAIASIFRERPHPIICIMALFYTLCLDLHWGKNFKLKILKIFLPVNCQL